MGSGVREAVDRWVLARLPATAAELGELGEEPAVVKSALRRLRRAGQALPSSERRGGAPVWYARRDVLRRLRRGSALVRFRRIDGGVRVYRCTLEPRQLPAAPPRQPRTGPITAYVRGRGWRRFYLERVLWFCPGHPGRQREAA